TQGPDAPASLDRCDQAPLRCGESPAIVLSPNPIGEEGLSRGTMKEEHLTRARGHEAPSPTVIHKYEEGETLLERWLRRGLAQGPKFWLLLAGTGVVV